MNEPLLSIFSFKTLAVRGRPPRACVAIGCALLLLLLMEGIVRVLPHSITAGWDYWSPSSAEKFLNYFDRLVENSPPELLVVGDSAAAYGFDPKVFDAEMPEGFDSFNLATLGNFPLSFDASIRQWVLTLSPQPKRVMLIFARGAFNLQDHVRPYRPTEQAILDAPIMRRRQGEVIPADVVHLLRVWPARERWINLLRGRPTRSIEAGLHARTGSLRPDRLTSKVTPRKLILDPRRFEVLEKTLQDLKSMELDPILVHAPVHSRERKKWSNEGVYTQQARELCQTLGLRFWDYSTEDYDSMMLDQVHLDCDGHQRFSQTLAERFRSENMSF